MRGLRAGLAVGAMLLFASVAAFGAATNAPAQTGIATLTGEQLFSCGGFFVGSEDCATGTRTVRIRCTATGGRLSWTATGIASPPYAGTFTETGSLEFAAGGVVTDVQVNFHIDSPLGEVDGRKFLTAPTVRGSCEERPGGFVVGQAFVFARYEAIIKPATGGSFADEGTASVHVFAIAYPGAPITPEGLETSVATISEGFQSDLAFARPLLPDAKEQCKDEGFLIFGVFENQGDCVSFVTTHGKNEPGKNNP